MSDNAYKSDMSIDERVMMAIVRVAERFKKNSSAVVKKWGLTFSQYNVLRVLDASENGQNTMRNVNRIYVGFKRQHDGYCQEIREKRVYYQNKRSQ